MKTLKTTAVAFVMLAMAGAGTVSADDGDYREQLWCGPTGTWIGSNHTFENEIVITIARIGPGRFSMVAESAEVVPPWEEATAWRGELQRTGAHTYDFVQVAYATPSQFTDPSEGVPDMAFVCGEITFDGCYEFEADIDPIELYAWGQNPAVDEPMATLPPSVASYKRLHGPCVVGDPDE